MRIFLFLSLVILSFSVYAKKPTKIHAQTTKINKYIDEGVIIGGTAGTGFTLLSVRRHFNNSSKIERVVIDLGEINGSPLHNFVSFFQVSLEKGPARFSIDLAQMQSLGFNQSQIEALFSNSKFVKKAKISYDPEDVSANLLFDLKEPIELEVFKLPSNQQPSRIVIDMKAKNKVAL